ncbi:MAG: isoleucine--tRNA ligase [Candidatus Aminicenantia bacterium]
MVEDYKDTLNLPKTPFPMKADLPQREPLILQKWEKMNIYRKILEKRKDSPLFILHDGPPYANGNIHLGHALNKILKDFIVKSKSMEGLKSPFLPGWDCHGLPIEHKVDQLLREKKKEMKPVEVRNECRTYAEKYVNIQREEFKRLGVFGAWENPYLTMSPEYESDIIRYLATFFKSGEVYRKKKPVLWCINCETALAEAEIEYHEHNSPSIWVAFPLSSDFFERFSFLNGKEAFVIIWTTTPWTLPANLAVALHPDFDYSFFETSGKVYLIADVLVKGITEKLKIKDYRLLKKVKGAELEGLNAIHPFYERKSVIILADYVNLEQGTGCVHTAPGHGEEDYYSGVKYNLEIYNPVDERGRFNENLPLFGNLQVFEANPLIVEALRKRGRLLLDEEISHSYPHCWRCKNPVIFRATEQWFISMDLNSMRNRAIEAVKKVKWIPEWGQERIENMYFSSPDWCISRQRIWGVPIPVFYCKKCGEILEKWELMDRVADIFGKEGSNCWFVNEAKYFLPSGVKCEKCGGEEFRKETDILDVWFESGSSHSVLERDSDHRWPADVYIEGNDQYRGWFNKSLLVALSAKGDSPFKIVITHGWVLDEEGRTMHKSLGNVISPKEIIDAKGAEILRLWVASFDYKDDVKLGPEIIERLKEAYRKIRNTWRFMLGNIYDFNPDKNIVPKEKMKSFDLYILEKWREKAKKCIEYYKGFEYHPIYHTLFNFFTVDLSALYLDVVKDRLYCSHPSSEERRSAQSAIFIILKESLLIFAPILPFTTEEAWEFVPNFEGKEESLFLHTFPDTEGKWLEEKDVKEWEVILEIRNNLLKALEIERNKKTIGNSLEAKVILTIPENYKELIEKFRKELPSIFIVSQVELKEGNGLNVEVVRADGEKCQRCWNYSLSVGRDKDFPDICERCANVLRRL